MLAYSKWCLCTHRLKETIRDSLDSDRKYYPSFPGFHYCPFLFFWHWKPDVYQQINKIHACISLCIFDFLCEYHNRNLSFRKCSCFLGVQNTAHWCTKLPGPFRTLQELLLLLGKEPALNFTYLSVTTVKTTKAQLSSRLLLHILHGFLSI